MVKALVGIGLLAASLSAFAQQDQGHVFVSGGAAYSNINIPENLDSIAADEEGMGVVFNVGYEFPNDIVAYAGLGNVGNFDWFTATDGYDLSFSEYGIGYVIKSNDFRLVPRLGYAKWETSVTEGAFANPGPEDELTENDYGMSLGLSMGRAFSEKMDGVLTYRKLHGDDADQEILSVDVVYHFK